MGEEAFRCKVLIISAAYNGSGGVALHVRYLAKALAGFGCDVAVHTQPTFHSGFRPGNPQLWLECFDPVNDTKTEVSGEQWLRLRPPGRRAPYERTLQYILGRWGKFQPDVVHSHDLDSALIGAMLSAVLAVPGLMTVHRAPVPWKAQKFLESPKDLVMEFFRVSKSLRALAVPSVASKRVLEMQGFHNIHVIPNGINYNELLSRPIMDDVFLKIGLDAPGIELILCPVRTDEHKSPDTFVRAAEYIASRLPDRDLVFLLTGEAKGKYAFLKSFERIGSVNLVMKPFESKQMPALFRRAAVCVVPSIRESFGQVALEAHAFKCPVVAANSAALPEIVRHRSTGLLFDPGSPDDLARQVCTILTDSASADAYVKAAYARLKRAYSADTMALNYIALYRHLLEK